MAGPAGTPVRASRRALSWGLRALLGRLVHAAGVWLVSAFLAVAAQAAGSGIDELREALGHLDKGDLAQARVILDRTRAVVAVVRTDVASLRNRTKAFVAVCDANLQRLEVVRGDVIRAQESLQDEMRLASNRLNTAQGSEQSAREEVKSLHVAMEGVQNAMRHHRERLAELERWWWVPGYGTYLGIRELVDHDANRFESLRQDLYRADESARQAVERAHAAREMADQLDGTIRRASSQAALLEQIQHDLLRRIGAFRTLDDYLHHADGMLEEVESIIDIQVDASARRIASDLRYIIKRANDPIATPQALRAENVASLSAALTLLADKSAQHALIKRLESEDCQVGDKQEDWRRVIDGPNAGRRVREPGPVYRPQ